MSLFHKDCIQIVIHLTIKLKIKHDLLHEIKEYLIMQNEQYSIDRKKHVEEREARRNEYERLRQVEAAKLIAARKREDEERDERRRKDEDDRRRRQDDEERQRQQDAMMNMNILFNNNLM